MDMDIKAYPPSSSDDDDVDDSGVKVLFRFYTKKNTMLCRFIFGVDVTLLDFG